jgi:hypothetical protein
MLLQTGMSQEELDSLTAEMEDFISNISYDGLENSLSVLSYPSLCSLDCLERKKKIRLGSGFNTNYKSLCLI